NPIYIPEAKTCPPLSSLPSPWTEYGVGLDGEKNKRRQHCTYCTNHGRHSRKTNHKCQFENCDCLLCKLTRLSRLIMRHQQRLWRHLKDARRREDAAEGGGGGGGGGGMVGGAVEGVGGGMNAEVMVTGAANATGDASSGANMAASSKQQKCDMCRNHGVMKEKRAHKNACPYTNCNCDLCGLTKKRRDIMRLQQRVRRSQVTSQQRNEAYDYVRRTTAELELAQLSMDSNQTSRVTPPTVTTITTATTPLVNL
ncbi:protein male abnormal 3-like, partial [Homarus americanus]|uniref:protein male abnormal 3-like n=1 Tax=Homarus americanus TaxID=6706 RepID=UPI001C450101